MFRRPVIVSSVGGPKERVRHEVDGLHFQLGDSKSLAMAMLRACTQEGLWDQLSSGIAPPTDRRVMVAEYEALYRESINLADDSLTN